MVAVTDTCATREKLKMVHAILQRHFAWNVANLVLNRGKACGTNFIKKGNDR